MPWLVFYFDVLYLNNGIVMGLTESFITKIIISLMILVCVVYFFSNFSNKIWLVFQLVVAIFFFLMVKLFSKLALSLLNNNSYSFKTINMLYVGYYFILTKDARDIWKNHIDKNR